MECNPWSKMYRHEFMEGFNYQDKVLKITLLTDFFFKFTEFKNSNTKKNK